MGSFYLAALVFGLGSLIVQFVASAEGDAGHDTSGDATHDAGGHAGVMGFVLSLRVWVFGLFAFGMVGTILHYGAQAPVRVSLPVALVFGVISGGLAGGTLRWLARSANNSGVVSADLPGKNARVLVPVTRERKGKVRVEVKGQALDFIAMTEDAEEIGVGQSALIVEIRGEVAVVARVV